MNAARRLFPVLFACLLSILAAAPAGAQQHTFACRVTINGIASDWHTFGLRIDAQPGIDAYDLPQPPPPPGSLFQAYLVMISQAPGLPNRWLSDFRPVDEGGAGGVELWQLAIESVDAGAACRLEVQDVTPLPSAFDLYLIGPGGGASLLSLPAVVEFPVDGAVMTRHFELQFGTAIPVEHGAWGSVKALYRG